MSDQVPQMLKEYREQILPAMKEKLGVKNVHQIPKISKVVVNCSVASSQDTKLAMEDAVREVALITGQQPVRTRAKKSISNFKLRENQEIGVKVTLRGRIMYEFLERLIRLALPAIRDFRGVPNRAFDGNGNYTLGIKDQTIFPEIELEKVKRNLGFDITIVTTAKKDNEAKELLALMGMPFAGKSK